MHSRSIDGEQMRPLRRETVQLYKSGFQSHRNQIVAILGALIAVAKSYRRHRIVFRQIQRADSLERAQTGLRVCVAVRPDHRSGISRASREHRRIVRPIARPNDAAVDAVLFVCRRDELKIADAIVGSVRWPILENAPATVATHRQEVLVVRREFHLGHGQLMAAQLLYIFPCGCVPGRRESG